MTFNENASLDTSRVGSGGGGGRGRGPVVAGGGIVGLIAVLIFLFTGNDITGGELSGGAQPQETQVSASGGGLTAQCKTGADANEDRDCRMVGGENSLYDYWSSQPDLAEDLGKANQQFRPAKLNLYSGQTQSGCGTASNQVGPFYCPLDEGIYIDTDFYDILTEQLGASGGSLAELYVLAHEYGHHIENLYGILDEAQKDPQGADSGAVRVELMADCMAGMWVKHASTTEDANGVTLLKEPTEAEINDAMSAAKAVGDDTIQERSGAGVNPDGWTHGSAKARQGWFQTGMNAQSIQECDTFAVQDPENP